MVWSFSMSYGSLSAELRNKVMQNTANGYSLYKWSNDHFKNKNVECYPCIEQPIRPRRRTSHIF